ncbi:MAG: hypothetical protein GY909_00500 [Oligoflexia bacterium]|nr:hypothetical protein [Oligoflexia bacterium]
MRIIFYSDDDALLDVVESLNSQNVFMTDDQEELLDLLEPESDSDEDEDEDEDIIVFFDFTYDHKKTLKFNKSLKDNDWLLRVGLFDDSIIKKIKKHQKAKECCHAYLPKPLTVAMINGVLNDFELADYIEEWEAFSEGDELGELPSGVKLSEPKAMFDTLADDDTGEFEPAEMRVSTEVRNLVADHSVQSDEPCFEGPINDAIQAKFDAVFGKAADPIINNENERIDLRSQAQIEEDNAEDVSLDLGAAGLGAAGLGAAGSGDELDTGDDDVSLDIDGESDDDISLDVAELEADTESDDIDVELDAELEAEPEVATEGDDMSDDDLDLNLEMDDDELDDGALEFGSGGSAGGDEATEPVAAETDSEDDGLEFSLDDSEPTTDSEAEAFENGGLDLGAADDDDGGLDLGSGDDDGLDLGAADDEDGGLDLGVAGSGGDDDGGLDLSGDDDGGLDLSGDDDGGLDLGTADDDDGDLDLGAEETAEAAPTPAAPEPAAPKEEEIEDLPQLDDDTDVVDDALEFSDDEDEDEDALASEQAFENAELTEDEDTISEILTDDEDEGVLEFSDDEGEDEDVGENTNPTVVMSEEMTDSLINRPNEDLTEMEFGEDSDGEELDDDLLASDDLDDEDEDDLTMTATMGVDDDTLSGLQQPDVDDDDEDEATVVFDSSQLESDDEDDSEAEAFENSEQTEPAVEPAAPAMSADEDALASEARVRITAQEDRVPTAFNESEMLRLQSMIRQLREERNDLLGEIKELQKENKGVEQDNLGLASELDELKIELSIIKKRHSEEVDEYRYRLRLSEEKRLVSEEKMKRLQREFDKLQQKVRVDFNQIRKREKELESKLELAKIDSESLINARDQKILELKRKIDQLEFNMENTIIKEQKHKEDKIKIEERLGKIMKTLRGSIELLEEDIEIDADIKEKLNKLK